MSDRGTLIVHRPNGKGRKYRGRPDVRIDGRVRGQLAAGGQVEVTLSAGPHRVQVGREAFLGTTRPVFFGSPLLRVAVAGDGCTRVRVDPTDVPLRQQMMVTESSFRLTEDTDGRDGSSTAGPSPADLARYPAGFWLTSPLTRGLLDQPQPWRSWQGAATAFLALYAAQLLVVVALTGHHHPRDAFGYVWVVFMVASAVTTMAAWVSLYRARRRGPQQKQRSTPADRGEYSESFRVQSLHVIGAAV